MIDRKKVIKALEDAYVTDGVIKMSIQVRDVLVALLKEQEAKTGKWIPIESPTGVEAFGIKEMTVMDVRCSACGSEEDVSFTGYKYCPRCGAKMEGRQSEWIGIRLSKGC